MPSGTKFPSIIQGGMGVAISGWPLANAVARRGELGVVSGTILEVVMARRLQLGDFKLIDVRDCAGKSLRLPFRIDFVPSRNFEPPILVRFGF